MGYVLSSETLLFIVRLFVSRQILTLFLDAGRPDRSSWSSSGRLVQVLLWYADLEVLPTNLLIKARERLSTTPSSIEAADGRGSRLFHAAF